MRIEREDWRELPTLRFRSFDDLLACSSAPACPGLLTLHQTSNGLLVVNYRRRDFYRAVIRVPMGKA